MLTSPTFRFALDACVRWDANRATVYTIERCRYLPTPAGDGAAEYLLAAPDGVLTDWIAETALTADGRPGASSPLPSSGLLPPAAPRTPHACATPRCP